MDEYFCPNCGATLSDQPGFDPDGGTWTCTCCGKLLMDDDVYDGDTFEGVAWYCDECGALLNRQPGFSDSYGSWRCTNCGHLNGTTEDDIIEEGLTCPNCGSSLKSQYSFSEWSDDHTCTDCGAKLHRSYSGDPFEVEKEDDGPVCPRCGARLKTQSLYSEIDDDWTCEECGAKLHREYSFDPYEEVDDNSEDSEDNDDNDDISYSYHSQESRASASYSTQGEQNHSSFTSPSMVKSKERLPDSELRKKRVKAFFFKRKRIEVGYDYTALLRRNNEFVVTALHNKGFNNIKSIPIKDVYRGSACCVGEVEQVVIDGSPFFNSGDQIPYNAEIIITYHDKKEITIPFSERNLRKINYVLAGDKLRELGFTEIYEKPIRDLTTGWVKKDGSVEKITIGEVYPFKKNSVFPYDVEITIEYHTFKKNDLIA